MQTDSDDPARRPLSGQDSGTGERAPDPDPYSAPNPASDAPPAVDPAHEQNDDALTRLHPNYRLLLRIKALLLGLVIVIAALVFEGAAGSDLGLPFGLVSGPALLLALVLVIRLPMARYHARGYQLGEDRLRVVRGVMWRSDTVVPFGRVQHIDVDRGPVERALDLATLTLHTAGNHNSSVSLPGLGQERADTMRETIRAHIRRESM